MLLVYCFDNKLVLEKAKKPVSYDLAIHIVFLENILHIFP